MILKHRDFSLLHAYNFFPAPLLELANLYFKKKPCRPRLNLTPLAELHGFTFHRRARAHSVEILISQAVSHNDCRNMIRLIN